MLGGRLIEKDRDAPALMQYDGAEIVDAVGLIGVLMGEEYRIDMIDLGVDQLLAQIGRGIDHDPGHAPVRRQLHQQRTAAAAVLRVGGVARAPAQRGARNAGRGSAAENRERERHAAVSAAGTLLNSRKKFAVVWREISSSETPRASASTLAISTT